MCWKFWQMQNSRYRIVLKKFSALRNWSKKHQFSRDKKIFNLYSSVFCRNFSLFVHKRGNFSKTWTFSWKIVLIKNTFARFRDFEIDTHLKNWKDFTIRNNNICIIKWLKILLPRWNTISMQFLRKNSSGRPPTYDMKMIVFHFSSCLIELSYFQVYLISY